MTLSLLDLPPELLLLVFEHLQHNKAGKRAICRALLPFTRANLLRRVAILSSARLRNFVEAFPAWKRANKPAPEPSNLPQIWKGNLARLVKELDLPDIDFSDDKELRDCQVTRKILAAAKGTEVLRLEGTGALRVLLMTFQRYPPLQHLHTLELADFDALHIPLYDMAHLGVLRLFPSLKHLDMDVHYEADEADPAPVKRVQPVPNIMHLSLSAGLSLSSASASNFISHFTRLTHLTLTLTDLCQLSLFLEAVSRTLVALTVEFHVDIAWQDAEPGIVLDRYLARFNNLEKLSLDERTFSPRIFTALSGLSALRTLYLAPASNLEFDAAILIRYLRGQNPDDPDVANATYDIEDQWDLPAWTPSFTFDDAKEIVRLADSMALDMNEELREAVEVEELRRREERYLEERREEVLYDIAGLFELGSGADEAGEGDWGLLATGECT
ncbi:hypothetical protein JCM10207_004434 [Rhodosporidiobolus poonsookiae]